MDYGEPWEIIRLAFPKLNKKLKKQLIKRLTNSILSIVPIDLNDFFRLLDEGVNLIEARAENLHASSISGTGFSPIRDFSSHYDWLVSLNEKLSPIISEMKLDHLVNSKKKESLDND